MKKAVILVALFMSGIHIQAQTHQEALRYSDSHVMGTARSAGMSNAFGALGADISTLSVNPAGLGVYRSFDFSFSFDLGMREMTSYQFADFDGSSSTKRADAAGNFNLNSIGFVAPYKKYKEGDWKRTSIGFAYNKTNIFRSNTTLRGYNSHSSMTDVFLAYAEGQHHADLNPFFEGLAFESYLIDPVTDTTGNWLQGQYTTFAGGAGVEQYKYTETSGSMGEFAFSYAGSYKEQLYLGATLGFNSLDYVQKSVYYEGDYQDTSSGVSHFIWYENLYTTGGGVNLKLGAILRANDQLRLGLAWHSPTFYSLQDEWSAEVDATHHLIAADTSISKKSPVGMYAYELITPMKVITSAALVLNKQLILSADLEFVDYTSMQLSDMGSMSFEAENEEIKTLYTNTFNGRFGAELNLSPFVIRGGYAFYGNPLAQHDDELMADDPYEDQYRNERQSYSIGLGKRNTYHYIDFAYTFTEQAATEWMYNAAFVPAAKVVNTYHNIMVTMGWKF